MPSDPIVKEAEAFGSPPLDSSDSKSTYPPSHAVNAKILAESDEVHDEMASSTQDRVEVKTLRTDADKRTPSISAAIPAKQTENDMPEFLQALGDAESARLKGNHAYSNGRLGDAIAIYTAADCLLTAASETEDGQSVC
jgi:hypothetical protein